SGSCDLMASRISSCAFWVVFADRTSRMSWSVCTRRSRYAATVAASSSFFAASATATWKSMLASVCGACSRTTDRPFSTVCSIRRMAAASARSAASSEVAVSTTVRASATPERVMRRSWIIVEIDSATWSTFVSLTNAPPLAPTFTWTRPRASSTRSASRPVLRGEEEERLVPVIDVLVDGVLRDIDEVAGGEVPARRLLGDARVVLLRDLGLDVPVQAVALAGHDVDGLVGHVPVLRAFAGCQDLLLVDVDTVGAHIRLLGRRDDAHAAVARVLPAGVALLNDLL